MEVVERLGNEPVDMLEINVSCPNVKEGGIAFWPESGGPVRPSQRSEKICKTARDHEAEP